MNRTGLKNIVSDSTLFAKEKGDLYRVKDIQLYPDSISRDISSPDIEGLSDHPVHLRKLKQYLDDFGNEMLEGYLQLNSVQQ